MNLDWQEGSPSPLECIQSGPYEIRIGDRVRLQPRRAADAFDLFLSGKIATVDAIETDLEARHHVAVVIEDDPGAELGFARQIGHRFFFAVDEVEPIDARTSHANLHARGER